MPPAPANDNLPAQRPASFDASVMAYVPGLRRRAYRFVRTREEAQDLVTDTIAQALEKWETYRGGALWSWLIWKMWGVFSNSYRSSKCRIRFVDMLYDDVGHVESLSGIVAASQEVSTDLARVADMLHGRNGEMLVRSAMGEQFDEIAADYGVSKQRVEQIVKRERERVRKRCGLAATAGGRAGAMGGVPSAPTSDRKAA